MKLLWRQRSKTCNEILALRPLPQINARASTHELLPAHERVGQELPRADGRSRHRQPKQQRLCPAAALPGSRVVCRAAE